jgi:hypothetical protein
VSEPFDPEVLRLLERCYTPGEQQRCRLCAGPMRHVEDIGMVTRLYRCARPPSSFGGSLLTWWRHGRESELVITTKPDPEVIALIAAYRELAAEKSEEAS